MKIKCLVLIMLTTAQSALPPGYEDELYCPINKCLKRREQRPGLCGPRTLFHECCNVATGETQRPRPWGNKLPIEEKESLLKDGWHENLCGEQNGVCGEQNGVIQKEHWDRFAVRVNALFALW